MVGLDVLLGGKPLHLPVTPQIMIDESYIVLPPANTVLGIGGVADPTTDLLEACRKARRAGYTLAVTHHPAQPPAPGLMELADMVRIDMQPLEGAPDGADLALPTGHTAWPPDNCRALIEQTTGHGVTLMACGIETQDDFQRAVRIGFDRVQGAFFQKPERIAGRPLTGANAIRMELLAELGKAELDFERIETVIKRDTALCYTLLKYLNSAALGIRNRITSIHQALVLLGERPLRRWGALVAITAMSSDKPAELLVTSLVRARFCERLGRMHGLDEHGLDLFLIGLLSSLDALLDMPMEQALASLPVNEPVREVLLGHHDGPLSRVYALTSASERGAWGTVSGLCAQMNIVHHEVVMLYYDTLRWVHGLYRSAA